MTRDEALTMIIASIAMEELALSHIINAEGEKLQYVLGTLPGRPGICASPQEVLAVNKSVTELLNTVMQNQMLLKGKLDKALEACGPAPEPSCPCRPDHPCVPPCSGGELCGQKSAIQLVSRCSGFSWDNGFLLSWRCQNQNGSGIRWDEENPALVSLDPEKAYVVNYAVNVCGSYCGDSVGSILVRLTPCDAFSETLPLHFSVKCPECEPLTLQYSTMLFPQADSASCAGLSLLLNGGSLFVEQASLNIFEL